MVGPGGIYSINFMVGNRHRSIGIQLERGSRAEERHLALLSQTEESGFLCVCLCGQAGISETVNKTITITTGVYHRY